MSLEQRIDALLDRPKLNDSMQLPIHRDIYFRLNSVNLVIGKRGSGKTYTTLREIAKLPMVLGDANPYTQIHYITDKYHDDTVQMFERLFKQMGMFFNWCPTANAEKLINSVAKLKADMPTATDDIDLYKQVFNYHGDALPHSIVIFDDCMGLFKKDTALSKKLFENRQSRITYFLLLQDTIGISPSMKANVDTLTLFGGFSRQRWSTLFYLMPDLGLRYENYQQLTQHDAIRFDFQGNFYLFVKRCPN